MKKAEDATELKDLQVDRVDGVDRPATGRKFILFKSAGEASRVLGRTERKVSFADVLLGPSVVQKGLREYLPGTDGVKQTSTSSVGAALDAWSGRATDATKEPQHPSQSGFDKSGPSHGGVRALESYQYADPWLDGRLFEGSDPGFTAGEGSRHPRGSELQADGDGAAQSRRGRAVQQVGPSVGLPGCCRGR